MENQGYEEEHSRADIGHVYEDIGSANEDTTDVDIFQQRNLTLPFRRGTGFNPDAASSSVRVTSREKRDENVVRKEREDAQRSSLQVECRPSKRRRKKDCKHCRSKAAVSPRENLEEIAESQLPKEITNKNGINNESTKESCGSPEERDVLSCREIKFLTLHQKEKEEDKPPSFRTNAIVLSVSEKVQQPPSSFRYLDSYEKTNVATTKLGHVENNEDKALIVPEKSRAGMRVNSIYSQERWYAKEAGIFFTDVKEQAFQRAYSLPVRTQTPSSQNRVNLRRSVRGEPPPHPARLHKHRHGWTLHLARPLDGNGCTRSVVLLLIVLLALLGVGGVALYIVFEPEKLQIIQQYLKSSTGSVSQNRSTTASMPVEVVNETSTTILMPEVLTSDQRSSFLESTTIKVETETPVYSNATRYCDDCLPGEVCVALVDEEVPTCRVQLDPEDPTGCAGFCLINKQKCHRLDVDAFRCVEIEHYCLDDEWTCSNTLCIPLEKHCDGHMNCYDHSDEYNCACNLETHFQCGNETSCLPLERRCDGKIDCWDATDEINCTLACPLENEFTCSNGQCILKSRFCDGLPDCADGSDEPHGCQGRCNKHEFTCQNSRCIAKAMKCNGVDDCGDGTDEKHCKDRST